MTTLYVLTSYVALAVDPTPAKEDVRAGWGALLLFLGLAVAVGLLGWSLVRQLRKTQANADAGVFGEDVSADSSTESTPQA